MTTNSAVCTFYSFHFRSSGALVTPPSPPPQVTSSKPSPTPPATDHETAVVEYVVRVQHQPTGLQCTLTHGAVAEAEGATPPAGPVQTQGPA